MSEIQITAQIVTCAVEVIAEPGDRLVIWDGKCLGVYHQGDVIKSLLPIQKIKKHDVVITDRMIIDALGHGPMTTMALADHLKVERGDMNGRANVGNAVRRLMTARLVEQVPGDSRRTPAWRLVEVSE